MTRLPGFLFRYPGFPSLTVPYHDTNDFFYSGHAGTCFILFLEARAKPGWHRISWACLFVLCNQWLMLMLARTHYVIDLVTGVIVAHYMHILGEKVSYIIDILWFRHHLSLDNAKERYHFKPCKECGWRNTCIKISEEERRVLKEIY